MQYQLQSILPSFFTADQALHSAIWRQKLCIDKGERVHLIAPSGSGKTSLMHFLYGLRKDYTGNIMIGGEDLRSMNPESLAICRQKKISIVFQDLRLFNDQPVHRNLEIKRALHPYHPQSRISQMAEQLGVSHKLNSSCSTCSYGEQQRLAIIRSLQQPFDFLLLDEPFSHLDENNRHKAMQLIEAEANERGAAIILADLKKIDYFKATRELHL